MVTQLIISIVIIVSSFISGSATQDKKYIKRVIALQGERISVKGASVYVNGNLLEEPYLKAAVDAASAKEKPYNTRNFPEKTVPDGTVFVMGDNRSNSADSRDIGFIKNDQIIGKVTVINGIAVE
ncbi:signal peptidase I [Paenibacillus periandrae]|uniref:signal peptidase I n=1 Tax=Paenibacillus periandrae TaxID=1761741 RepID=UPI001F09148A|nr:signal peptidase I [Paenibacillus periandrae]